MRLVFIFLFSSIGSCLLAQTKEIAFKSHSGNMKNFKIALENELFNTDEANFGLPPEKRTYVLDSVIYISDTAAILVTRTYSRKYKEPADSNKLVETGKDTVYNDPLFTRKHSLDSIKNVLKINKKYINPLTKTVFVGFDNKKSKIPPATNKKQSPEKNILIPVVSNNGNNNNGTPFDSQLLFIVTGILMLSAAGGWLSWKLYQPRLQKA